MKSFVLIHWLCITVHGIQGNVRGDNRSYFMSTGIVSTSQGMIKRLTSIVYRESALVIMFDKENEHFATEISSWRVNEQGVFLFSVENTRPFLKLHLKRVLTTSTSVEATRRSLNFVVTCGDCLHDVLNVVCYTGDRVEQQTIRHFSTWLFITHNVTTAPKTCLDNVAWIQMKDTDAQNSKTESEWNLATLLWMAEGRLWSEVFITGLKDEELFNSVFPNVKRGLNGGCILVSALQWVPQTMRQVVNGSVKYVGANIDIIQSLAAVFNFTFRVIEPRDGSWGAQIDNGSWTGIIGMMERQEADMTGAPYTSTVDRGRVMEFSPPLETTEFVFVYTKKKGRLYIWKFLIAGFSWEVYVCGAVVFSWSLSAFFYITRVTKDRHCSKQYQPRWDVAFVFTSIALRQDMPACRVMHHSSERALVFSWAIFCFLITAIYSGSLVASATVDKTEVPFQTIEDLVEQNEYTVGVFEGHVAIEIVKNSKVAVYQKLYKKIKNNVLSTSSKYLTEGLNLIQEERYALLSDTGSLRAMRAISCDISVMKESLFSGHAPMGFPRYSPLRKLFLTSFRWMSDTGILTKTQEVWHSDPKPCEAKTEISSKTLELKHLTTLFVVCCGGVLSSASVLAFERWRFQRN